MRGFAAGLVAGAVSALFNWFLITTLKMGNIHYHDFAAIIMYGRMPRNFLEKAFAQGGQMFFSGLMGAIFGYLISWMTTRYLLLKAVIFGVGVWFAAYTATMLYKVPHLDKVPPKAVLANLLAAVVYGLVIGWLFVWTRRRLKD